MASVSALLPALCEKIRGLAEPGTDMELRRVSMACIFVALHNLGNARRTTKTRKSMSPVSTSQFLHLVWTDISEMVTKVQHRTSGKTFAMKTLDPLLHGVLDDDPAMVIYNLRVLRQACFMAACRGHPSIVRLHAVCKEPDTEEYRLLMEHLGPSLSDVLACQRRHKPFPEHEVRHMMRQILSGAKAMHELGIVHRGIVSENVLVAAGGDVFKIGGFGQATCVSETDVPFEILGRDDWAPELLLQQRGAYESELLHSWSIGRLMAELLTGWALFQPIWHDESKGAQLYSIFDVLGIPDKRAMQRMKPHDLELAKKVREWRARRPRVGKKQQNNNYRLRKLVPPEVLSDDGFRVLRGLLTCNPRKRLTAADALELPWFSNNNDDNPPAAAEVSQQVSGPVSRPWPFTWLLVSVLLLLCLVVFVWVGSRY
ncbi:hypothetical protein QOZ80_1BG0063630 [Eleusine coracana subsp. coracana]|nr:hypothetical protein QOZ80_1BG0063630 [Eleusine coracana subsp. coracana]